MKKCNRCKVQKDIQEFLRKEKYFETCNNCSTSNKRRRIEIKKGIKSKTEIVTLKRKNALLKDNYYCPRCDRELSVNCFNKNINSTIDGYAYICKECQYKRDRIIKLKNKHKLSFIQVEELLNKESYSCAICNKELNVKTTFENRNTSLNVDHCHETGKIRGLLCSNCNRALGLLQDNEEVLLKAYEYLKKHKDE